MRYFALDVALLSTTSTVLTYTCGVAYALLTIALLVRYVHNMRSRGFGVMKLSMLLLMGYVLYSGTRAMTLLYSAVAGRISNTMLILPTAWYLLLMGFMARLWSMYLSLLVKEKQHRGSSTVAAVAGGALNNSSFPALAAIAMPSTGGGGGGGQPSMFSQRAVVYVDDAKSCLVPTASAVTTPSTLPSSSPATTHSSSSCDTTTTTTTNEDGSPRATPPPAAVPRTIAAAAAAAPSPLMLTATALSHQLHQQSPPSSPTSRAPSSSSSSCCTCQCVTDHPLSFAVIVVSSISASIIFSLGIMCSNVSSLEHTHCVDIPSIADVAACWACGSLMVVLAYRLYRCGAAETTRQSQSPTYHLIHQHYQHQARLPPRSSRPPPHITNLTLASSVYSVPWVSSGASLSVASSSDPDFDHHHQQNNVGGGSSSINADDRSGGGVVASESAAAVPTSPTSSCCSFFGKAPICCVVPTCFAATRCGSIVRRFFSYSPSYQNLHARTVAAAFLFGGYTITRGCAVASNIFAAEKSNLTHHDEEYLTPAFYVVEWICLVLCARLIVGPPRTSSSSLS
jgi:hypothetical protein